MADKRHAPWPWTFAHESEDDNVIRDAKGNMIVTDTAYFPSVTIGSNDWPMVAASPELLHAAKTALFVLNIVNDRSPGTNEAGAIKLLTDAIAKAEGR